MTRHGMTYALGALLLAGPAIVWAAPPDMASMSGDWKITGDVHGRPVDMTCRFTEADLKLSGTCTRSAEGAEPHPVDGTVKGQKVQFQLQTALGSKPITLIVTGKLNPESSRLAGDLDVEPLGVGGKFEGQRQSELAAGNSPQAPATAPAASTTAQSPAPHPTPSNYAGTWKVDADFQGTAAELSCVLKQDGITVTGTCTGEDGKANPVKGEVTDRGLTWRFDAEYQGQPITVTMNGKLNADGTMQGDASVAPLEAEGTFSATRQQPAAPQPSSPVPTAETPPTQ